MQTTLNSAATGMSMKKESAGSAAQRASVLAKSGRVANNDMLESVTGEDGKVSAEKLKEANSADKKKFLPKELQGKTIEEQTKILKKQKIERDKLMKRTLELSKKRDAFIRKELSKRPANASGFDIEVINSLQRQAKKSGIEYKSITPAKTTKPAKAAKTAIKKLETKKVEIKKMKK